MAELEVGRYRLNEEGGVCYRECVVGSHLSGSGGRVQLLSFYRFAIYATIYLPSS